MYDKPINMYWCLSNNFGDKLNCYLAEKMTGHKPYWIDMPSTEEKTVMVGSVLSWCNSTCKIWGAGIGNTDEPIPKGINISAVRGKRSLELCNMYGVDCPEIFGDPALLLPDYYAPVVQIKHEVGCIPHYVDQKIMYDFCKDRGIKYINVFDSVEKVINDILSCECICSSALHGLIVSEAYGKPTVWFKLKNGMQRGDIKYFDYYTGIGVDKVTVILIDAIKEKSVNELKKYTQKKEIKFDKETFLKVRTF